MSMHELITSPSDISDSYPIACLASTLNDELVNRFLL